MEWRSTGRAIRLGGYHLSIIERSLAVFGPDRHRATTAETKLAALLETMKGAELMGRIFAPLDREDEPALRALATELELPMPFEGDPPTDAPLDYDEDSEKLRKFNLPKIVDRYISELQGMCSSIVADGKVDNGEIDQITKWLVYSAEAHHAWPVSELVSVMSKIQKDGRVMPKERSELLRFLETIAAIPDRRSEPAESIFDNNVRVTFPGRVFLLTGKLELCARSEAWNRIKKLGGRVVDSPQLRVDYLVVGSLGSDAWRFSRYGRKIEAMMEHKKAGRDVAIIDEQTFAAALDAAQLTAA